MKGNSKIERRGEERRGRLSVVGKGRIEGRSRRKGY